jgi:hypothetical protein
MEEMDQILIDPERRRDLLAAFSKDPEFFDVADTVKTPLRESIDLIDTRPTYLQPCFLPPRAPQVLPEQNINGIRTRSLEEPARQAINSDQDSARLIKTTSAQEDQLWNMLPSHFPQFRHVQNYGELGFYIDRSQYAISVGSGPVDYLHYGIIIVPFGEEHMIFRSEHESREVPLANQHKSSLRSVDEVQPRIVNSVSSVAAPEPSKDSAALSKVRTPLKRTRNRREKSLRITKTTRTPGPTRRSQRLKAGTT